MDINFYSLDLSERKIIPPTTNETENQTGYVSMNAVRDFNDVGSFQLTFWDDDAVKFAKAHPEGYFVVWGEFEGIATDFQFTNTQKQIYGSHLNALLNNIVFPAVETGEYNVNQKLSELFSSNAPWIVYDKSTIDVTAEFGTDAPKIASNFVNEYLAKAKLGHRVYIGKDKKIHFEILSSDVNPLVLSESNLNVYDVLEDFSNKELAFGGYFKKTYDDKGNSLEEPVWEYITSAEKEGIYKRDVILDASSLSEAQNELEALKSKYSTACKTRNVTYGTDYKLGDVVRFRLADTLAYKQVTSFNMWFEGATIHQEPTLSNWED